MESVKPIAVVVEDDYFQCEQIKETLEAKNMQVIRCDTAEAAELVIARTGLELELLVTDVELAGSRTGLELARFAQQMFPDLKIVVVSGTKVVNFIHISYRKGLISSRGPLMNVQPNSAGSGAAGHFSKLHDVQRYRYGQSSET